MTKDEHFKEILAKQARTIEEMRELLKYIQQKSLLIAYLVESQQRQQNLN